MSNRPLRVLLSSFGPFAGRLSNGSRTTASFFCREHSDLELRHVPLEVIWDEPARTALPVIRSFGPDILIGLGEGKPGQIAIEARASNLRNGTDLAGRTCRAEPIEPEGEAERLGRCTYLAHGYPACPFPAALSQDCGTYLCNEALYRYCGLDTPTVAFLHLPPQNDTPDETYYGWIRPVLANFIQQQKHNPGEKKGHSGKSA
jgi:pyrrolidone-carboxylate peptidase